MTMDNLTDSTASLGPLGIGGRLCQEGSARGHASGSSDRRHLQTRALSPVQVQMAIFQCVFKLFQPNEFRCSLDVCSENFHVAIV